MPHQTETGSEGGASARLEVENVRSLSISAYQSNSNHFDIAAAKIALRCAVPIAVIAAHLAANFGGLRHG